MREHGFRQGALDTISTSLGPRSGNWCRRLWD